MNLSLQYDGLDDKFHQKLLKFFTKQGFQCVDAGRITPNGLLILIFHKDDPWDNVESTSIH